MIDKKINEIRVRTRYGETDQMGVIYHGNYAQYLEMGRVEWLRSMGVSYRRMEEKGIMLPVISMTVNFKKPAKYDDVLIVKTILNKKPTVKITFDYEVCEEASKDILTTASVMLAFMDIKTRKPMMCPDFLLEKLDGVSF